MLQAQTKQTAASLKEAALREVFTRKPPQAAGSVAPEMLKHPDFSGRTFESCVHVSQACFSSENLIGIEAQGEKRV